MAKVIQKNFEGFRGNYRGMSVLSQPPGTSRDNKNIAFLKNGSISKRKGLRAVSSNIGAGELGVYSYLDGETGETKNELLCFFESSVGSSYYFSYLSNLTPVSASAVGLLGAANQTFSLYVSSAGAWTADLKTSGVSVSGWPKTYGDGFDFVTTNLQADLLADGVTLTTITVGNPYIFGLRQVTDIDISKGATVDGDQVSNVITVLSGHNITADIDCYICSYGESSFAIQRRVTAVTATTITISGEPIYVGDGTLIRSAGVEYLLVSPYPGGGRPHDRRKLLTHGFQPKKLGRKDSAYQNNTLVNQNDVCYIVENNSYPFKYDGHTYARAGMPTPLAFPSRNIRVYTLPFTADPGTVVSTPLTASGAGSRTGVYRWAYTYVFEDAKRLQVESDLTEIGELTLSSNQTVAVRMMSGRIEKLLAVSNNSTQTTTTTITMDFVDKSIKPGDDVLFNNGDTRTVVSVNFTTSVVTFSSSIAQVLSYSPFYLLSLSQQAFPLTTFFADGNQTEKVFDLDIKQGTGLGLAKAGTQSNVFYLYNGRTSQHETLHSYPLTQAMLDQEAVTVLDNDIISTGMRIRLYRTFAGGTDYYLVDEIPHNGYHPTNFYSDIKLDSELGFKYLPPVRRYSPPPKARYILAHQGIQVLIGDDENPNTVFFSEPNDLESYPVATNAIDIPFTIKGPITGAVSEQDILVIFKERGRAVIRGELFSGNFNVEILEDGIGCASFHSIAKTPIGTIFLSFSGFQLMNRGEISREFSLALSDDFENTQYKQRQFVLITPEQESKPVLMRAIAVNDYVNNLYLCCIPKETGTPGVDKSISLNFDFYCFDYEVGAWVDYEIGSGQNPWFSPVGGLVMFEDRMFLSNYSFIFCESDYGNQKDYADNTTPIEMKLQDSWIGTEEPSILKKFLRLKVWSFAYDYFLSSYLTLKTYLDFRDTTPHTTATMDFTSSSTIERLIKLRGGQKARSLMVEFSNNNLHEAPVVTGYELEVAPIYDKEIKE